MIFRKKVVAKAGAGSFGVKTYDKGEIERPLRVSFRVAAASIPSSAAEMTACRACRLTGMQRPNGFASAK